MSEKIAELIHKNKIQELIDEEDDLGEELPEDEPIEE
jgi:hypothetical protein